MAARMQRRFANLALAYALALCASLTLAILPCGQMPKVAGPCGQALCNCPIELSLGREAQNHCATCYKTPGSVVTLISNSCSGAYGPGLAFQLAIGAAETTVKAGLPEIATGEMLRSEFNYSIDISEISSDIPTPPPRA